MTQKPKRRDVIPNVPRTKGYTNVPNSIIRDPSLSVELKLMLIYLKSYDWGGGWYPSQPRMAAELGLSERTIRRLLSRLQCLSLVRVVNRGSGRRNKYLINLGDADTVVRYKRADEDTDVRCKPDTHVLSPVDTAVRHNIIHADKNTATTADVHTDDLTGYEMLAAAGINEPVRSQLAATNSSEEVRRQITWLAHNAPRNPPGMLVAALRQRWGEPPLAALERIQAERKKESQQRAERALELVDAASVPPGAIEAARAMLPMERYKFHDQAREQLGGTAAQRIYGAEKFREMVAKLMLHLIGLSLEAAESSA